MSIEIRKCTNGHEFGWDRTKFLSANPKATYITCPICGDHVPIKAGDLGSGQDWITIAAGNGISKSLFNDRVNNLGWTQERAATTLKRGAKPKTDSLGSLLP